MLLWSADDGYLGACKTEIDVTCAPAIFSCDFKLYSVGLSCSVKFQTPSGSKAAPK